MQEVTLIFVAVESTEQVNTAFAFAFAHVVTRSNCVSTLRLCVIQKGAKFDFLITQDIWIGCTSLTVFIEKVGEYTFPVFVRKIDCTQWNAECAGYGRRIAIILARRTMFVIIFPVLHEDA